MTRIGLAVAFAILVSVPVLGQAQEKKPPAAKAEPAAAKPAEKPAAKAEAKAEKPAAKAEPAAAKPADKPAAAAAKPVGKPAAKSVKAAAPATKLASASPRRSRATEDARVCLQQSTDAEIRKCAEDYR